jgi:hypothetical protein
MDNGPISLPICQANYIIVIVEHKQHEFHQPYPTHCPAPLPEFVLDIPYLVFGDVIPRYTFLIKFSIQVVGME